MKELWKFQQHFVDDHVFAADVQVLVCASDEVFENWIEIHILSNILYRAVSKKPQYIVVQE